MGDWTFFSNHGHVLVCLARDSDARLRDVAISVGITERAVQKIVRDLQDEGYLEVSKHGRRNRYRINNRKALRHQLQAGCTVGQLLGLLTRQDAPIAEAKARPEAQPKSEPESKLEPEPDPEAESEPEPSPEPKPERKPSEPPDSENRREPSDLEQGQLF